jgi:hypothetical protein
VRSGEFASRLLPVVHLPSLRPTFVFPNGVRPLLCSFVRHISSSSLFPFFVFCFCRSGSRVIRGDYFHTHLNIVFSISRYNGGRHLYFWQAGCGRARGSSSTPHVCPRRSGREGAGPSRALLPRVFTLGAAQGPPRLRPLAVRPDSGGAWGLRNSPEAPTGTSVDGAEAAGAAESDPPPRGQSRR